MVVRGRALSFVVVRVRAWSCAFRNARATGTKGRLGFIAFLIVVVLSLSMQFILISYTTNTGLFCCGADPGSI